MVSCVDRLARCPERTVDRRGPLQVVTKRAKRSLQLKEARLHIVTGFLTTAADVEAVVRAIREARDGKAAKAALQQGWQLSDEQADAVLNMPLRRLTGLAIGELTKEDASLRKDIKGLQKLLDNRVRLSICERTALLGSIARERGGGGGGHGGGAAARKLGV